VNASGYRRINGTLGKGFLEKRFPGTCQLYKVMVNPGSMDVLFMGNQVS
jgi:hypothetical protein